MTSDKFNFDDLNEFVKFENARWQTRDKLTNRKEAILAGVTKLSEETGELASEILINLGLVRKEKIHDNSEELAGEFADCALVLWMLADRIGVDMTDAIQKKIAVVRNRNY